MSKSTPRKDTIALNFNKTDVLADYRLAHESRQASLLGRREVLTGKAKFGIFGDGKEIAQLAMAKQFKKGDWRSGYYRDQTFMMATGMFSLEEFFAQLYGDTDQEFNPGTAGRLMNNHFATRYINADGTWMNQMQLKNSSADVSPTAGQMPRLLGLAYASKFYRHNKDLADFKNFTSGGNEVAFGTIGDSSTSEGIFWEAMNAAGVLQVPMAMSVWDDGYGISVPRDLQTIKSSISEALAGFAADKKSKGFKIYKIKGWDYAELCRAYAEGIELCRKEHIPVLFHVVEITQPQGHSTSGSHERYKSAERLKWEDDYDGLKKMREWIVAEKIATAKELDEIEKQAAQRVKEARRKAWKNFMEPLQQKRDEFLRITDISTCNCAKTKKIAALKEDLARIAEPISKDTLSHAKRALRLICDSCSDPTNSLKANITQWFDKEMEKSRKRFNSHLYSEDQFSALKVAPVAARYADDNKTAPGREILRDNFDKLFEKYPLLIAFGEDVGHIGGVNQTYEGLQEKYGEQRIFDTGIREATIIGQGIGLAMRGLRPIAEIQYFDYLLYALHVLSDDLATLTYRTKGGQKAPLIVSTRGHRLEGIWHSGSPLSMVINSIRGMHVLVPRNLTQAAGFYNTLMAGDDPAVIIEPLNGYRLRERVPENLGEFRVPIGIPEVLKQGTDITVVTYGSCVRIAQDAAEQLQDFGIDVELIDVQSLLPFDLHHSIVVSLKKTNKILFFDEDVPGGATAFMMQKVLEEQKGYYYLDTEPRTVTAKAHRPAYSTDGDYFSNPNAEDVFDAVYNLMHDVNPYKYPKIF
ncbi:MAG: thiamine pyrophosphate-dependent enzyme [Bacteroidales bacterium]|jgi:pyruvate/2-oxoglutarate/acetoin dehydrogenase E1 component/TPP-dependent pyruvate/acetoin dehydrogenase alpha subunit|nr:thiamine pyrophosphate-dependent enzyme [Bacteroidales bacterium]